MGLKTSTTGTMPTVPWDEQADRELADVAAAAICRRAFDLGLDLNDKPFPPREDGTPSTLGGSGPLREGIRQSVVVVAPGAVKIRVSGKLATIVDGLSKRRPFLGLSPRDQAAIAAAVPAIMQRAMARHQAAL